MFAAVLDDYLLQMMRINNAASGFFAFAVFSVVLLVLWKKNHIYI